MLTTPVAPHAGGLVGGRGFRSCLYATSYKYAAHSGEPPHLLLECVLYERGCGTSCTALANAI